MPSHSCYAAVSRSRGLQTPQEMVQGAQTQLEAFSWSSGLELQTFWGEGISFDECLECCLPWIVLKRCWFLFQTTYVLPDPTAMTWRSGNGCFGASVCFCGLWRVDFGIWSISIVRVWSLVWTKTSYFDKNVTLHYRKPETVWGHRLGSELFTKLINHTRRSVNTPTVQALSAPMQHKLASCSKQI